MKIEDKIQEALDYICIDQVGSGEFIEPSLSGVWRAKKEILALIGEWRKDYLDKFCAEAIKNGGLTYQGKSYKIEQESLSQKKEGE